MHSTALLAPAPLGDRPTAVAAPPNSWIRRTTPVSNEARIRSLTQVKYTCDSVCVWLWLHWLCHTYQLINLCTGLAYQPLHRLVRHKTEHLKGSPHDFGTTCKQRNRQTNKKLLEFKYSWSAQTLLFWQHWNAYPTNVPKWQHWNFFLNVVTTLTYMFAPHDVKSHLCSPHLQNQAVKQTVQCMKFMQLQLATHACSHQSHNNLVRLHFAAHVWATQQSLLAVALLLQRMSQSHKTLLLLHHPWGILAGPDRAQQKRFNMDCWSVFVFEKRVCI